MGDSRGRWDGRTLVVDTTNVDDRGWIASSAAGGRIKGIPVSEALLGKGLEEIRRNVYFPEARANQSLRRHP